ncbi:MAG: AMP-binding protein [Thermodesulfobacteriota bacterium]|nr:AMP-binding protein [Thermodesulfobacteriota bacterium]
MEKHQNPQTVWKALNEAVKEMPDQRMYIFQSEEITFKDVDDASDHIASGLLKMGFKKGDRIGIIAHNQPEWIYTYFAAAKIGAVLVALNVRYRDTELKYMLNQSETRALVSLAASADFDYVNFLESFRTEIPTVTDFIFIGDNVPSDSIDFNSLMEAPVDYEVLDKAKQSVTPDDLLIIIYTSGTTGMPKGAAISHKSQLASAIAQAEHAKVSNEDCMLIIVPLNHVGGITCAVLSSLIGRATGILIPQPDIADIIKQAAIYKPNIYGGVPTLYSILFMYEDFLSLDMSNVRIAISGGSNAEPSLLTQIKDVFPNAMIMNLYGLSETSGAVVLSPWDSDFETTVRSIGKPIGNFEIKIVDTEENEVGERETGELCFRGDAVCRGYFQMPEETAETFDSEGWLHTGDMGYIDEKGYIVLRGRKKEMYLQGGYNVYPVEVENLLATHPKILMVAGIGIPDPVLGEVGRYYIIPQPGTDPTEDELKTYCGEHLADYKIPKHIIFRESLPLTPVGKVMKLKLKEDYKKTGQ